MYFSISFKFTKNLLLTYPARPNNGVKFITVKKLEAERLLEQHEADSISKGRIFMDEILKTENCMKTVLLNVPMATLNPTAYHQSALYCLV